jgi:hypothetical protein
MLGAALQRGAVSEAQLPSLMADRSNLHKVQHAPCERIHTTASRSMPLSLSRFYWQVQRHADL